MRNQFYSDRKDIWKWSLLLELAGNTHHIFQIAMLRPDEGTHGNDFGDPGPCNPAVRKFFDVERSLGVRDLSRIGKLRPGQITVFKNLYMNGYRAAYFNDVLQITCKTTPKVIFLDPDNGIEGMTRGHKHVGVREISRVWRDSLTSGDYLVIFQYGFRDSSWCAKKKELLCKTIGRPVETRLHPVVNPVMCYFWAQK
jgi:hypothetical protein